jgi:divalent metal cation (Fe/Co/Zn/Cd) transporter
VKPWVAYSLLRVGLFVGAFALLYALGVVWWLSAALAAVLGLCISYIFFGRLRAAVARDLADARARPATDADADIEDADIEDAASNADR